MGNCQAVDTAAALVIQHPSTGKSEKLFWPILASHIMKSNPGYYVALLITTTTTTTTTVAVVDGGGGKAGDKGTVRITRVKLLKPTDTLTLGHVYRLISAQEVMKGLVAKKQAKMMKMKQIDGNGRGITERTLMQRSVESKSNMAGDGPQKSNLQVRQLGTERQRSLYKAWQPSLKSISESQS